MKTLSILAVAAIVAGLASACSVRTETVERPAPATAAVVTAPAPSTVVYTDPVPATTAVTVTR
jgi:hypothetical protein